MFLTIPTETLMRSCSIMWVTGSLRSLGGSSSLPAGYQLAPGQQLLNAFSMQPLRFSWLLIHWVTTDGIWDILNIVLWDSGPFSRSMQRVISGFGRQQSRLGSACWAGNKRKQQKKSNPYSLMLVARHWGTCVVYCLYCCRLPIFWD